MKLSEAQFIFAKSVAKLINIIAENGYSCSLGEAYRTPEMAEIYAQRGTGIRNSLHCRRLAIDLNLFSPEGEFLTKSDDYAKFGLAWKRLHNMNRWGGEFHDSKGNQKPDGNHFEMNFVQE
jgi:hypothetical protein